MAEPGGLLRSEPGPSEGTTSLDGNHGHGLLVFDHNLSLQGANTPAENLFGISVQSSGPDLGKNILDLIPGIGHEETHSALRRVLRTGEPYHCDCFPPSVTSEPAFSLEAFRVADCLAVAAFRRAQPCPPEIPSPDSAAWHWALLDAIENAGQGIVVLQNTEIKEAAFVYANDASCGILGYSRDELLSISAWDFFDAESLMVMQDRYRKGQRQQRPTARYEAFVKTGKGEIVPLECSATTMHRGSEVATVILFRDVRRDKEMERALADSGEQYRAMVDTAGKSGIGIEIVQDIPDREAAIVFVNEAYCNMLGYTRGELLSMSEWDVVLPDELGSIQERYHRRRRGEEVPNFYRMTLVRKDGRALPIETSVSLMKRNGHLSCVSYFRDVSETVLCELALAQSEERHRALVDATGKAGIGIEIVQDRPGMEAAIVFVNDEYCQMLGYSREELLSMSEWDVLAPSETSVILDRYRRRQSGENVEGFYETVLVRKDGGLLPVASSVSTMTFNGLVASVSYFREITEQKRVEEELRQSYEQLRQLSAHLQRVTEEEGKRIAREVHDGVGQTLTALKMDLSWLSKRLPEDQPGLLQKTMSISRLADMAIQAVRRISAALRPRLLDELGLAAAIEWQLEELQDHANLKGEFVSNMKEMMLDQDRATAVFRICQEALWNAGRHAEASKVKVALRNNGTEIVLTVRDNGKGIAPEQISNPKSFGLTGMRERAAFLGGRVKIIGCNGKGTTVTATIPLEGQEMFNDQGSRR